MNALFPGNAERDVLMNQETCFSKPRIDTLSGDYIIYQPENGQRYCTDDMLVAWLAIRSIREGAVSVGRFLDLGSGLCSVAMIFLWGIPKTTGCGIEINRERMLLGRKSLAANGLSARFHLIHGDIRNIFLNEKFSLMTSTPPYYMKKEGPASPNGDKSVARFEINGTIFDYFQSAAVHLNPGGAFITAYPFQYAQRVLAAAREQEFYPHLRVDVIPRQPKPPLISLFRFLKGVKGRNASETLAVRNEDQSFTQEYKEVRQELGFKVSV